VLALLFDSIKFKMPKANPNAGKKSMKTKMKTLSKKAVRVKKQMKVDAKSIQLEAEVFTKLHSTKKKIHRDRDEINGLEDEVTTAKAPATSTQKKQAPLPIRDLNWIFEAMTPNESFSKSVN